MSLYRRAPIGTVFLDGKIVQRVEYLDYELKGASFADDALRFVGWRAALGGGRYPFGPHGAARWLAIRRGDDPLHVVVPAAEVLRHYYGTSQALLNRVLDAESPEVGSEPADEAEVVRLQPDLAFGDAWMVRLLASSATARRRTRRVFASAMVSLQRSGSAYPRALPPVDGDARILLRGFWLSREGRERFVALRIQRSSLLAADTGTWWVFQEGRGARLREVRPHSRFVGPDQPLTPGRAPCAPPAGLDKPFVAAWWNGHPCRSRFYSGYVEEDDVLRLKALHHLNRRGVSVCDLPRVLMVAWSRPSTKNVPTSPEPTGLDATSPAVVAREWGQKPLLEVCAPKRPLPRAWLRTAVAVLLGRGREGVPHGKAPWVTRAASCLRRLEDAQRKPPPLPPPPPSPKGKRAPIKARWLWRATVALLESLWNANRPWAVGCGFGRPTRSRPPPPAVRSVSPEELVAAFGELCTRRQESGEVNSLTGRV